LGLEKEQVEQRVNERDKWYGIVDGQHSHAAIINLRNKYERWCGFLWFVCLLRGGHSIDRYRQLAQFQNARHDSRFFIETTFFDVIKNLKAEYKVLKSQGSKCTGLTVVKAYTGIAVDDKKFRTLVQTANAVIRLSDKLIDTIGEICNSEYPDLCIRVKDNSNGSKSKEEIMSSMDCRVYRSM